MRSCFGNKYNITPVRRELLTGMRAVVVVDASELEDRVRQEYRNEIQTKSVGT